MTIRMWRPGAVMLCLVMCSACCRTEYVRQVETVKVIPPAMLMQTVEAPVLQGGTNRDVVTWAIRLQEALATANANLNGIRAWCDGERD